MELKNLGQTAASALIHTDIRLEREHWTMFRNKLLGIAAAATLGSAAMLGSTAAYAIKICDTAPTARTAFAETSTTCFDSVTFAAETLLMGEDEVTAANDAADTTVYSNIGDTLFLAAPTGVGGIMGDGYTIEITLDGMVFRSASATLTYQGTGSATFNSSTGGQSGDSSVTFSLASGAVSNSNGLVSLTADFAVSANGGSATLVITNPAIAGPDGTETHPGNPIMVAPALSETSTKMNPTADVEADGFMMFEGGRTTASLGTLQVGAAPTYRQASAAGVFV